MPTGTKRQVMTPGNGIDKTAGGLTKKNIKTVKKNGQKHYVSKKKSTQAKKTLGPWNKAVAEAKKEVGVGKHEFVLLNRGAKGKKLYKAAAEIYYG